ncbi:MAG: substrate-binding domain-containing protein [Pseudomonadota bacterium]
MNTDIPTIIAITGSLMFLLGLIGKIEYLGTGHLPIWSRIILTMTGVAFLGAAICLSYPQKCDIDNVICFFSPQNPVCPQRPVSEITIITIATSSTKEEFMEKVVANFNAGGYRTRSGAKIKIELKHVLSGGSMNDILSGKLKPVVWSPGVESWVKQLNGKTSLMSQACQPTIYSPLGIAMWRPMAEALGWPNKPISWKTIIALAEDGWASYGHPEWGSFHFGHAHPKYSNAGLLTMTSFVYGMTAKTDTLKPKEVYDAKTALKALAQNTSKYGMITTDLLNSMDEHGSSFLHAVATFESDTVDFNLNHGNGLLAFIFPADGTFFASHPYCILDKAEWVNPEQAEAAAIFRDYLLKPSQQRLAVDSLLRPLDSNIPLHAPLDLAHGTDPRVTPKTVPPLPFPDASLSETIIDVFMKTKRKATVLLVLDTSSSMGGEKIRSATNAAAEFLERLQVNDVVAAVTFNDTVVDLSKPQPAGVVVEPFLKKRVKNLIAGGGTALYDAVCHATRLMEDLQQADLKRGDNRLYGIVLLSDGEDTSSQNTEKEMFIKCLPTHAEAENVKIFPIAFGADADLDVLKLIAKVTGGQLWEADPDSIDEIYIKISAEQ